MEATMTKQPTPMQIRLAVSNAIIDHNTSVMKAYNERRISWDEYRAQMFPAEAIGIIRNAINAACDQAEASNAA